MSRLSRALRELAAALEETEASEQASQERSDSPTPSLATSLRSAATSSGWSEVTAKTKNRSRVVDRATGLVGSEPRHCGFSEIGSGRATGSTVAYH